MLENLLIRDVNDMNRYEIEEECRELEDAYADALKDNAGYDALSRIWGRIRELQSRRENYGDERSEPDLQNRGSGRQQMPEF